MQKCKNAKKEKWKKNKQEAQLLLGDRASVRRESMPRVAEMDVEMTP